MGFAGPALSPLPFLLSSRVSDFLQFQFSLFYFPLRARLCDSNFAVNLNRTQILGALILAAIALVILLLRWKFAH